MGFISKIVHVIVGLNTGGAELMLKRLIMASLKNSLHQHSVISLTKEGVVGKELVAQGIEVKSLDMRSAFSAPKTLYKLVKIFRKERPAAVYTWMYHGDLLGGLAAVFCGIKDIIWGIRNTTIPQRSFSVTGLTIKICSVLSYYVPSKIVCCAEAAKLAHLELGYCPEKIIVIPNGYDLSLFDLSPKIGPKTRRDLGISESHLIVGIIGRFDPLKDFNNFVQASSKVCDALDNINFLMVGRGLDENNLELKKWIEKTGHADKFFLVGEKNNPPVKFLAAMDVFCLSSKSEGFPNVVAEAMAMQVPCVVTDVGDAAIIVEDRGIVVEPMNADALSEGLIKILSLERHERQVLGRMGREAIKDNYDIKKIQKRYLDLTRT